MKLFECQQCGQRLYFENTHCERCGRALGYVPERELLSALEPLGNDVWGLLGHGTDETYRFCGNAVYAACNWLVPRDAPELFCLACRLNRTIPDLTDPQSLERWRRLELGKHQLVYGLLRLGLPVRAKQDDPLTGLAFDFLETYDPGATPTTGHEDGVITIDAAEADPAEREQRRTRLHEPYRTITGHFRHEVGHYYWQLFADAGWVERFRVLFEDERQDYGQALERHYREGPPVNWRDTYVTAYASSHPWEDWAETWAHYLHIVDTMDTAYAFGIAPRNWIGSHPCAAAELEDDPYREADFDCLIEAWLPLTFAVNSLNRSMGQPDLYPFVLSPCALEKLRFVHDSIREHRV